MESKLRNLKFRAGPKIPEFLHELRSTFRDYYGLTNDAKILQPSVNVKIENLLELITIKLSKGFSPVQPIEAAAHSVHNDD